MITEKDALTAACDLASSPSSTCVACGGRIELWDIVANDAIRLPRGLMHVECPTREVEPKEVNDGTV